MNQKVIEELPYKQEWIRLVDIDCFAIQLNIAIVATYIFYSSRAWDWSV